MSEGIGVADETLTNICWGVGKPARDRTLAYINANNLIVDVVDTSRALSGMHYNLVLAYNLAKRTDIPSQDVGRLMQAAQQARAFEPALLRSSYATSVHFSIVNHGRPDNEDRCDPECEDSGDKESGFKHALKHPGQTVKNHLSSGGHQLALGVAGDPEAVIRMSKQWTEQIHSDEAPVRRTHDTL